MKFFRAFIFYSFVVTFGKRRAISICMSETNRSHVDLQLSISLLNRKKFTGSTFLCVMDEYCSLVVIKTLVPKFAGSNPAEAFGFFGRKNPQHAFLRRGSKTVCPMSCFTACKRTQT
jgi:hypothetical protein